MPVNNINIKENANRIIINIAKFILQPSYVKYSNLDEVY